MENDNSELEAFKAQSKARSEAKAEEKESQVQASGLGIDDTYVKQVYSLAWRFFTNNKMASFIAMGVLFVLYMFSMIPIFGLLIAIAAGIVMLSIQVYIANLIEDSNSNEEFDQNVANISPSDLLIKYMSVGSGAFVGFIVFEILMGIVFFSLIGMSIGMDTLGAMSSGQMAPEEQMMMYQSLGTVGLFIGIIMMFIAYVYPLVLGRVLVSESFSEAFRSIFLIFSPSLWGASFNGRYFLMMLALHATGILMVILLAISIMTLVLIPLAVFLGFIFMVYFTVTAVQSRKIVYDDV